MKRQVNKKPKDRSRKIICKRVNIWAATSISLVMCVEGYAPCKSYKNRFHAQSVQQYVIKVATKIGAMQFISHGMYVVPPSRADQ